MVFTPGFAPGGEGQAGMNGETGVSEDQHELVAELLRTHVAKLIDRVRVLVHKSRLRLPAAMRHQVEHLADIVFQETCLKVLEKADQFNPALPFEVWFVFWANKELIHEIQKTQGRSKKHKREHFTEGREYEVRDHRHEDPAEGVLHRLEVSELRKLLDERLPEILNEQEIQLFYDKFLHFEDNEELARRYGKNPRSIAVQCCRIRARVVNSLVPDEPLSVPNRPGLAAMSGKTTKWGARS